MNNEIGYLVPANAKKSSMIFGMFWKPDLVVLGGGIGISIILLLLLGSAGTWLLIAACIPMALAVILVMPIPNYHNTMIALKSLLDFNFNDRRKFIWKGWCVLNEFKEK